MLGHSWGAVVKGLVIVQRAAYLAPGFTAVKQILMLIKSIEDVEQEGTVHRLEGKLVRIWISKIKG